MTNKSSENIVFHHLVFWPTLLLSLWYLGTSWVWVYLLNVVYSFPAGLVAFIVWFFMRKRTELAKGYKWIKIILITGTLSSLISFLGFFLMN